MLKEELQTSGPLILRVKETLQMMLVREDLKARIEKEEFTGMTFIEAEKFTGNDF